MEQEIWVEISGFKGIYAVSNAGRLKRLGRFAKVKGHWIPDLIINCHPNDKGYIKAKLVKNKTKKTYSLARLVALHFIPNPEGKKEVNHKDCNKANNAASNLEWCTAKENTNHAQANGRRPVAAPHVSVGEYPKQFKPVRNKITGEILPSVVELKERLNMDLKGIRRRLAGERPNTTDWEYVPELVTLVYSNRQITQPRKLKTPLC